MNVKHVEMHGCGASIIKRFREFGNPCKLRVCFSVLAGHLKRGMHRTSRRIVEQCRGMTATHGADLGCRRRGILRMQRTFILRGETKSRALAAGRRS